MELQNTHVKCKTRTSWTVYEEQKQKKCKLSDKSKDQGRTGNKQVKNNENNEM